MADTHASGLDFIVQRDDWSQGHFEEQPAPAPVSEGQVLFRVDRFAFTANNISYAKAGDMLRYWDFFPAEQGFGRIPVMGFADVIESAHPGVAQGQRVFGFFPMSRYLVIEPSRVGEGGIFDGAPHRQGIAPAYNTYAPTDTDLGYAAEHEDAHMLMRGLFMTSYLVDDYVTENDGFGASQVVISSASSKTSIALAYLVSKRAGVECIGLTSPANAAFVKGLGYYDQVIHYDDLEGIADEPTVFVDMAGSGSVTNRLHARLGERMKCSCSVGVTHFDDTPRASDLPGAKPEFFFAPSQIQKRAAEWGPAGLNQRIGDSWQQFRDASSEWLEVRRERGRDAVERVYHETREGRSLPSHGHVISLWDAE
ncbi:MAG: DUF2855 family protein [Myxococcota bacterium]|nr:DUF2855 family protein [Myxococcota bacterium]